MSLELKDPQARVEFALDWASDLDGATIVASLWSIAPAEDGGLEIFEDSFGPLETAVRLQGGIAGRLYFVSNLVTLSSGLAERRSILMRVEEK
jgi:hypothetical protein